jgi:hypothetical protein
MKSYQFLLLDAGPIIKLFELDLWNQVLERCKITITRTVANETVFIGNEEQKEYLPLLETYEKSGQLTIIDPDISTIKTFFSQFDVLYQPIIHDGEKDSLAFLFNNSEEYNICSSDGAVFRVLGLLGLQERGVSLEKLLADLGMSRRLKWEYTEKFRMKYSNEGGADFIQGRGLIKR